MLAAGETFPAAKIVDLCNVLQPVAREELDHNDSDLKGYLKKGECAPKDRPAIVSKGEKKFYEIFTKLSRNDGENSLWSNLYKGYVDDQRATDNAWIESRVYHLHLTDSLLRKDLGLTDEDKRKAVLETPASEAFGWDEHYVKSEHLHWVTVEDSPIFEKRMFANHKNFALEAHAKLMPELEIIPLAESRLVAMSTDDEILKHIFNVTGLVDEHNCRRLLNNLWEDADRPASHAEMFPTFFADTDPDNPGVPLNTCDEFLAKLEEFFKDRNNWSRYNLQRLCTFDKDKKMGSTDELRPSAKVTHTGIQELSKLQLYTTHNYKPLAMPVHMLSLRECNNMKPFEKTLIPTDQLECLSRASRPTSFHLHKMVFESGSMHGLLSRKELQYLKAKLLEQMWKLDAEDGCAVKRCKVKQADGRARWDGLDPDGKVGWYELASDHLELSASPLASVTFNDHAQQLGYIPERAVFFCFINPYEALVRDDEKRVQAIGEGKMLTFLHELTEDGKVRFGDNFSKRLWVDPFFNLLTVGGFVFFDIEYKIVDVKSLCFIEVDNKLIHPERNKGVAGKLYYGRPTLLPESAIRPLVQNDRWQKVSVSALTKFGFTHFAWIKPSEFLGEYVFPKHGGFAYLTNGQGSADWGESKFFPLISPPDDTRHLAREADGGDNDDDKDDTEAIEPKQFTAPLHVAELNAAALSKKNLRSEGVLAEGKFCSNLALSNSFGKSTAVRELVAASGSKSAMGIEIQLGYRTTKELLKEEENLKGQNPGELVDEHFKDMLSGAFQETLDKMNLLCDCDDDVKPIVIEVLKACAPPSKGSEKASMAPAQIKMHIDNLHYVFLEKTDDEAKVELQSWQEVGAAKPIKGKEITDDKVAAVLSKALEAKALKHPSETQGKGMEVRAEFTTNEWQALGGHNTCDVDDFLQMKSGKYFQYEGLKTQKKNMVWTNDNKRLVMRDEGRKKEQTLQSFAKADEASACNLQLIEVAALRLYTTSTFVLINDPLRDNATASDGKAALLPKHPLGVTTYHITSALKKLRALNFRDMMETRRDEASLTRASQAADGASTLAGQYLWRGMRDVAVSDYFMSFGGSEPSCMSTSESIEVVAGYALSSKPLLLRIKVDSPMERGAKLDWLSMFPHEKEILYPPLTYLKPMLKQRIHGMKEGTVITLKAVFPS